MSQNSKGVLKLIKIICWILSVSFIMGFIPIAIGGEVVSGLIMLVFGIALFPLTWKLKLSEAIPRIKSWNKAKKITIGSCIGVFLVVPCLIGTIKSIANKPDVETVSEPITTTAITTTITTTVPETTTTKVTTTTKATTITTIAETTTESSTETTFELENSLISEAAEPQIEFISTINGRGTSDEGRSEPKYEGLYGYAVVDRKFEYGENYKNTPWKIPIYKNIDADHFEECGSIEHKTIVKVLSQNLKHEGWGFYSGYLTVCLADNFDVEYIIDVKNFITKDYWNYDIISSVNVGPCIMQYSQTSDYFPVDSDNDIVNIADKTQIYVDDKTGTRYNIDDDVRQIQGKYYVNGNELTAYFNEKDLKIIY